MKAIFSTLYISIGLFVLLPSVSVIAQRVVKETVISEKLLYHPIHINSEDQTILPWYSPDLGKSYDFVIEKVWNFWHTMRNDKNGLPYYMNHQVWRGDLTIVVELVATNLQWHCHHGIYFMDIQEMKQLKRK